MLFIIYLFQDRLKESGLNDHDVAKRANADYQKLKKKSFPHAKAWEVVKDYDKWQKIALLGENTSKRKPTTETGSNDEGINFNAGDESFDIPNLNEDNTPTQSRRSKKSRTDSGSLGDLEKTFADYAISKQVLLDKQKEQADRKKEKDDLQIQDLRKKTKARDWKIYTEPHEHITNTRLLKVVIQQKTEIAETYGWDKYWEME